MLDQRFEVAVHVHDPARQDVGDVVPLLVLELDVFVRKRVDDLNCTQLAN